MHKRRNSTLRMTGVIAAAVVFTGMVSAPSAQAAQTSGSAPYMNQWLVAGPLTTPVTGTTAQGVDPVLGHTQSTPDGTETSTWQYFDDRIFNRNYDDYNDLMGYFDVKQGQPTLNKWVTAATYVYSPAAQTVQWQIGGSGVYRAFAGDALVGAQTAVANRVSKSGTRYALNLQKGWNKLVLSIQHKNTGSNANFLGFYARLSDASGNTVPDLTYSTSGPNGALAIATTGLDIDKAAFEQRNANVPANEYPDNGLPVAYDENPYVEMKATLDGQPNGSGIAPQASAFAFEAGGGAPGYRWTLAGGALPPGLTLTSDGRIQGTVAKGAQGDGSKPYAFTVRVTDATGASSTKRFTITVKRNPVDWFIDGKMSALSHTTGTMPNLYDPNFNYDEWAQTAKQMGMTMLSTESLQNTIYYWPSPNANLTPDNGNKLFKYGALEQTANGSWQVKDRVMQAKQAAERYDLKFGVYVSSLYEGRPILESDIQNLVARYNPSYVFADGGPESYSNPDVAWSSARNYNDRVLIDANPNAQTGDQDITLHERPFWNSEPYDDGGWVNGVRSQGRKTAHEEWNDPYTTALDVWTQYAGGNERDDWRSAAMEMIDQYGHGYVMNYDSSIAVTRGMDNLSSNLDNANIFSMVPVSSQQLSDMRQSIVHWMDNPGGPDLRESMYGTTPYTLDYVKKPGWSDDPQRAIAFGEGPDWGYAMSRDQNVYLHLIKNQIKDKAKSGFTGQDQMENIGPFSHEVTNVQWLNRGEKLPFTVRNVGGKHYVSIDTSTVRADPIDTIIKVTTDDKTRDYALTGVKVFSSQHRPDRLELRAESYLNHLTNVLAPAKLKWDSDNRNVAKPHGQSGEIRAGEDGTATITVTATYRDGVNKAQVKTDTFPVVVKNGVISPNLPLTGVEMRTAGDQFWKELSARQQAPIAFNGFTQKGGSVDLIAPDAVSYHYATVTGRRDNPSGKVDITEVPGGTVPFTVADGTLTVTGTVNTPTMYSFWADITVNGKTFTSTRNFVTVRPDANVAAGITPDASADADHAKNLTDGVINEASGGNHSAWELPAGESGSLTYDLRSPQELTTVNLFYDHHMPNPDDVTYTNAPKSVKIEYSMDGKTWTTGTRTTELSGGGLPTSRNTKAVPKNDTTLYGWEQEGNYYNYPVDSAHASVDARYVRVSFPDGGQDGKPVDVLETRILSLHDMNALASVTAGTDISADGRTARVTAQGTSFQGGVLTLNPRELRFSTDKPQVATVGADGTLTAVGAGRVKVTVSAERNGYRASGFVYVDVDQEGRFSAPTYLTSLKLTLNHTDIKTGSPITATVEGTLNTGAKAVLSPTDVQFALSDNRLKRVDGTYTVVLAQPIDAAFSATISVVATYGGVSVDSDVQAIKATGANIAATADVTVSSVRDKNGDPNGDNQDSRYVGTRATDGDRSTSWAARKADATPKITLRFASPVRIDHVDLVERGGESDRSGEGLLEWEGGSKLVSNMQWQGQPDNLVRFDTPITTSWVSFTIDPNQTIDNLSLGGESGLAEFQVFEVPAGATIVDVVGIEATTNVGQIPSLPERVDAVSSDGTLTSVPVTWGPVSADDIAVRGRFTITGTIAGTEVKAQAVVTVR